MNLGQRSKRLTKLGVSMGLLAMLFGLMGCDQDQVDKAKEVLQKTNDGAKNFGYSIKPDPLLFKGIVIGESTEEAVRKQAGKPDMMWEDDDGTKRLEYPRGPNGGTTWAVTIDKDGKVAAIEQILTAANIAKIRPGMTKDEVRRILGKPTVVNYYSLKKEEVWGWRWFEDATQTAFFNAHFENGDKVTTTSRNDAPERSGG